MSGVTVMSFFGSQMYLRLSRTDSASEMNVAL